MTINPYQLPIKVLFEQNHTFEVPKYQRSYAWDDEAIDDFVDDMRRCLAAREANSKRSHFFGGVVTVRTVASSSRTNQEVIDGQQRLASFIMLVAVVVRAMRGIVGDLVKKNTLTAEETQAKGFLEATADALKNLYLVFRDSFQLVNSEIPKMKLSEADNDFFQLTITESPAVTSRASHERIREAWTRLDVFITAYLAPCKDAWEKAKHLQLLVGGVLTEDCTVVFMSSDSRAEAYQIFQVLNDRGVHLTDGDLLRARTMERLDEKELLNEQAAVAEHWDKALAFTPTEIDSYLRWYFSSLEGYRPKSSNLVDQFLESRFKCKEDQVVTKKGAGLILAEVQQLEKEFEKLDSLGCGEWPYDSLDEVAIWDRERLRMLVIHLKHTNAMPLLLSLQRLDAKKFAEAVAALERFVFRYKTIGNAHISPMTELYLTQSKKIRETNNYSVGELRTALATLVQKVVPDGVFEAALRELKYSTKGGNTPIRYLLTTLEDYSKWLGDGANGMPKCKDKTHIFDFSNTTIEHIYPRSAPAASQEAELEKSKHFLGNLTIFGPDENNKVKNKSFAEKRSVLQASSLKLNRTIGENASWTSDLVAKRTDSLVKMAMKVFIP